MGRYVRIDKRIWNDGRVRKLSFPPGGRNLWFYILTADISNHLGAYKFIPEGVAADLGWNLKAFREAFHEVLREGLAEYSPEAHLIFIPSYLKYHKPESPNVIKSWKNPFDELPECELKVKIFQHLKAFAEGLGEAFAKAFKEAFGEDFPKPETETVYRNSIQYTEKESDNNNSTMYTMSGFEKKSKPNHTKQKTSDSFLPPPYEEIINDLNSIIKAKYRVSDKTKALINARLREGFTIEDFKTVHRKKAEEWGTQDKMRPYLRPITLYSNKFESYLNQPERKQISDVTAENIIMARRWLEEHG